MQSAKRATDLVNNGRSKNMLGIYETAVKPGSVAHMKSIELMLLTLLADSPLPTFWYNNSISNAMANLSNMRGPTKRTSE